jgi:hypothetical protein
MAESRCRPPDVHSIPGRNAVKGGAPDIGTYCGHDFLGETLEPEGPKRPMNVQAHYCKDAV